MERYIKDMEKFKKEVTNSPENSLSFLVKAGICTPKGNLKKEYK